MKVFIYQAAAMFALSGMMTGTASAATPSGFSSVSIPVSAQVNIACQEAQQASFPSPFFIDTLAAIDQTFAPTADEAVTCTNGTVFSIRISSSNGAAVNQVCTSSGVSGMAFKSASAPADVIPYLFLCAGDTDGSGSFTGAGFSTPRALGVAVKITAANAQAAKAHDDYSDNVTMTISY